MNLRAKVASLCLLASVAGCSASTDDMETSTEAMTDARLADGYGSHGVTAPIRAAGSTYALQPDGKLLVAGTRDSSGDQLDPDTVVVARYDEDGLLDPTFGVGGIFVSSPFEPGQQPHRNTATKVAINVQQDGSIRLLLTTYPAMKHDVGFGFPAVTVGTLHFAQLRLRPNGMPDPVGGGTWTLTRVSDVSRIIPTDEGGFAYTTFFDGVYRIRADGTWDDAFRENFVRTCLDAEGTVWRHLRHIARGPRGTIVVGGGDGPNLQLVRVNGDGSLDTSFGGGGVRSFDVTTRYLWWGVKSLMVTDSGAIVVAGTEVKPDSPGGGIWDQKRAGGFVARVAPTGDLDLSFGDAGVVDLPTQPVGARDLIPEAGDFEGIWEVTSDRSGRLVGAGWIQHRLAVVRLDPNGKLDASFGAEGIVNVKDVAYPPDLWDGFDATSSFPRPLGVALDGKNRVLVPVSSAEYVHGSGNYLYGWATTFRVVAVAP